MSTVGERILLRRTELNMSQDELAIKVGYKDRSSIAKIESGERDIRQSKVVALANALRTTPQWLMGYDNETEKPPEPRLTEKQAEMIERIKNLTPDQVKQVKDYIEFLISQRDN